MRWRHDGYMASVWRIDTLKLSWSVFVLVFVGRARWGVLVSPTLGKAITLVSYSRPASLWVSFYRLILR